MTPLPEPIAQMTIRLFAPAGPGEPNQCQVAGPVDNPAAFVALLAAACNSFLNYQHQQAQKAISAGDGLQVHTQQQLDALNRMKEMLGKNGA